MGRKVLGKTRENCKRMDEKIGKKLKTDFKILRKKTVENG